jgi:hypothetical protein
MVDLLHDHAPPLLIMHPHSTRPHRGDAAVADDSISDCTLTADDVRVVIFGTMPLLSPCPEFTHAEDVGRSSRKRFPKR